MIIKVGLSKQCLTRLIWPKHNIQEETVAITWSLKVKLVSKIIPRSLVVLMRASRLPRSIVWKSLTLVVICLLPQNRGFILAGFNNSRFLKHRLQTLRRSWFIFETAISWPCSQNNMRSFVSKLNNIITASPFSKVPPSQTPHHVPLVTQVPRRSFSASMVLVLKVLAALKGKNHHITTDPASSCASSMQSPGSSQGTSEERVLLACKARYPSESNWTYRLGQFPGLWH